MVSKSVNSTKKILTHTNVFGLQNIKNEKVKKNNIGSVSFSNIYNSYKHRTTPRCSVF
jgi:hypothetical protein